MIYKSLTGSSRQSPATPLLPLVCFTALAIMNRGMSLLLLPIYLRHIPPSEYGVLAAVTIVATVIAVVSNLKLDAAMRTFYFDYYEDPDALQNYLRQNLSMSIYVAAIVYAVMLVAGSKLFGLIFAHEELQFYPAGAIALATASINACLSSYFVYLRNSLLLWELIRWQLLTVISTVALQILFVVVLDMGLYGVLWGSLLPAALMMLLLGLTRPGLFVARPDWRSLLPSLKYSLPLAGLGLAMAMGTRLDRLVLERYVDLESLGAYAILVSLLGLLGIVLNLLNNAIRPYLYTDLKSRGEVANNSIELYQKLYLLAGLLALSFAIFLGSNLHFVTDRPAYLSIQNWLLLGATAFVPAIFTKYYVLFYEYYKRSAAMTAAILARFGLLFVLLILFVPRFAIAGALWAVLISEFLTAVLFWFTARRLFGLRTSLQNIGLQLSIFLGTIWCLNYFLYDEAKATFGVLQLLIVAGLLLAVNRHTLRAIFASN
jgi:O-antigen/teichoic acid export membrane protein